MVMQYVAAGAAILGTASSMFGSNKAAKQAKEAAKLNAKNTYAQRMEEIRRRQLQDNEIEGLAVATSYANNVQMSGSPKQYIDALKAENMREREWAKTQAKKEEEYLRKGGQTSGQGAMMLGQAASGISNAVLAFKGAS
jgi:hypothetical protein